MNESTEIREFPDWETRYREDNVEEMPWFYPELDPDFDQALERLRIHSGNILDLGTGPGTQAIELAKRGFAVTATDVSSSAITKATARLKDAGVSVDFRQDDILNSTLNRQFDIVMDRGCFHVFSAEQRPAYLRSLKALLEPGNYLLLKTFSHRETMEEGPYRFKPEEIEQMFADDFTIISITDSAFPSTLEHDPKALFCILKRKMEDK